MDAYSFDEYDYSMSLFIAEYDGENEASTLTLTEANALFERLNTFLDGSLNGNFRNEMEISTPAYDLVERIVNLEHTIRKYKFFIVTDKAMSGKISTLDLGQINGISIEYNIWDIQRLYRVMSTGDGHEPVEIDFLKITEKGLPQDMAIPFL